MRPPQTLTERQRSKMGIMPLITKRWQNGTRNGLISSLSSVNPFCVEVQLRIHPQYAISKTVQLLKANSSKWINERRKLNGRFEWQRGYGAFSVSQSMADVVKEYIANQSEHHREHTFEMEYIGFLQKHCIEYDPQYVFEMEIVG